MPLIPPGALASDDPATLALLANAAQTAHPALVQPGLAGGDGGSAVIQALRAANVKALGTAQAADPTVTTPTDPTSGLAAYAPSPDPTFDVNRGGIGGPIDGLAQIARQNLPPHSLEREGLDGQTDPVAPAHDAVDAADGTDEGGNEPDESAMGGTGVLAAGVALEDPQVVSALVALYGAEFPLARAGAGLEDHDWVAWAETLWRRHHSSKATILWMVERLRKMRVGEQWISAVGLGPWRTPSAPREMARIVDNVIAPALDYRLEVLCEQRPGWKMRPINQDQRTLKRAEAQQAAVDYQYDQQEFRRVQREIGYYAGTDGVCFTESCWDPDRGPWDEVVLDATPGATGALPTTQLPQGELATHVHRIEDVCVSANATATIPPDYWIVRKQRTLAEAVKRWGPGVTQLIAQLTTDPNSGGAATALGTLIAGAPDVNELKRDQELVDEYTVYCAPSWVLPHGLTLKVVGQTVVVSPRPLLYGTVPMVRWTDGSSDPSFFPRPIAYDWIPSQMRINALWSKLYDNVRLDAGTKLLAKREALSSETLTAGTMTVYEVRTGGAIGDAVQELGPSRVSSDVLAALQHEMSRFEQLSGWNDAARGSVAPDQSGRAILANREMLERVFAPLVNEAASSASRWAEVQCAIMRWGYDEPRAIAVVGTGRSDLAREVSSADFDGVAQVTVDPETLMPLPRALRLFILEDLYTKGLISAPEYRRRMPFGFVGNLDTPDTDHYARAQRACDAVRQTAVPNPPTCPVLWMDDPAIHQDVLARELILPDDTPQPVRAAAYERWMMYAQLAGLQGAQAMQGGPAPHAGPPMPMAPPGAAPSAPPQSAPTHGARPHASQQLLPAGAQPFQGTSPGLAAATAPAMASGSNEQMAGRMADITSRQP